MTMHAHYKLADHAYSSHLLCKKQTILFKSVQIAMFGMSLSTLALANEFESDDVLIPIDLNYVDSKTSPAMPSMPGEGLDGQTYNFGASLDAVSFDYQDLKAYGQQGVTVWDEQTNKVNAVYEINFDDVAQASVSRNKTDDGVDDEAVVAQAWPMRAQKTAQQATDVKTNDDKTLEISRTTEEKQGLSAQKDSLAVLMDLYQGDDKGAYCQGNWYMPSHKQATPDDKIAMADAPKMQAPDGGYAHANYGYYNNQDYAELVGDVMIYQDGKKVLANKVTFNPMTKAMDASGQVIFSDDKTDGESSTGGLIGVADQVSFDGDGAIVANDVAFANRQLNAHGYAQNLISQNDGYTMNGVMFSTCPPNHRKWHIEAASIDMDKQSGRAVAKNSTFNVNGMPVLYLPYLNFPIDSRRATGFLLPTVGFNSNDGLRISTPYYVNLAPNYDATIHPTVFVNRNPMLAGEFRYMSADFGHGRLDGAYLPKDKRYLNQDRSHLFFDHRWQSKAMDNLSAYATYRHVSDNQYLTDFDILGLSNNPLNLPRQIGIAYHNDYLRSDLRIQSFQTLDATDLSGDAILDKDKPYHRLPQLSLDYTLPSHWLGRFEGLQMTGTSQFAYFKKSIKDNSEPETSGVRLYNQLSASMPLARSWGYVMPKLSLAHLYTSYDADSQVAQNLDKNSASSSVFVPQLSVDAGLHLQKAGAPFGLGKPNDGYQLLSPRIKYLYSPHKDQSNMPNFDTVLAPMTYEQLLADTWLLGYDRILDIHAITPALNYRYVDGLGKTRVDASIAQQIYLKRSQILLHKQLPVKSSSGLAWQASIQPWQNLWFDTAGFFTPNYDINALIGSVRYMPSDNQLYNFGVIERKKNPVLGQSALSALTASAIVPVNERWQLVGLAQFDTKRSQFMDALIGVNYEDCCLGLSVYGRHYRNDLNPNAKATQAIMAELRLTGITNQGRLFKLLNEKILGFERISSVSSLSSQTNPSVNQQVSQSQFAHL